MAENRRGKDNRFYFSRGQMVLLGGAFSLAAVIIFVLGVFVGKGIEESKVMKKEEPLVKIPVSPTTQNTVGGQAPQFKEEITFNDSLAKPAEKIVKAEPKDFKPQVKAEAPAERAVSKRVEKTEPADDALKKTESERSAETKDHGAVWRAQVNAFPDDRSAKQLVERLKNKGYNAYVTEVQNRGKTWYRVSVGKYNSREQADKAVEALKSKENYTKAFVATK
jgi:cell division septation protein DedD